MGTEALEAHPIRRSEPTLSQNSRCIVATIMAAGPLLEERTRQHKEAERRRQIAEVERYEEQQRRKLERNRWRRFLAYAKAWQDAQLAQEFVAALKPMNVRLCELCRTRC